MHHASGRFPSTVTSKMTSGSRRSTSMSRSPGAAAVCVRINNPAWSSPRPSSRPEQSIPFEVTPRIFRFAISKPPGSTAPTGASGTRSPSSKLVAPQTISSGPPPASTTTRRTRSAPSIAVISSIRAITTSLNPSPTTSISSTTRPRSSSVARRSPASSGNGAKSLSHDSGVRNGPPRTDG